MPVWCEIGIYICTWLYSNKGFSRQIGHFSHQIRHSSKPSSASENIVKLFRSKQAAYKLKKLSKTTKAIFVQRKFRKSFFLKIHLIECTIWRENATCAVIVGKVIIKGQGTIGGRSRYRSLVNVVFLRLVAVCQQFWRSCLDWFAWELVSLEIAMA